MPDQIEPVTGHQIRSILELAFGDGAAVESILPLEGGSINRTFEAALRDRPAVILRVAPSDAGAAAGPSWLTPWGLRREQAVIALATPALGDLLPVTIASDFDRAVIDRDWVVQERMPGVQLSTVDADLSLEERTALWIEFGQLTRRLHDTPGEWFGPPAAGPRFDRLSDLLRHDADGLRDDAGRFDLPELPFRRLRDRIVALAAILDDNPGPRLVHSDLAPTHVFVARDGDGKWRVSGVIDLEFGRFCDPRFEGLISEPEREGASSAARDPFLSGYGRRFDTPEDRSLLHVSEALGHGWSATLLAFQGRREHVPGVIARMENALAGGAHSTWTMN
ncbi:MAG: aminoglycoside phosphotransferase family protein [Chloroflexia bacterium]|nr:aminoglycoside phosphotransferase family protein [Chloroflexia bacterium]